MTSQLQLLQASEASDLASKKLQRKHRCRGENSVLGAGTADVLRKISVLRCEELKALCLHISHNHVCEEVKKAGEKINKFDKGPGNKQICTPGSPGTSSRPQLCTIDQGEAPSCESFGRHTSRFLSESDSLIQFHRLQIQSLLPCRTRRL